MASELKATFVVSLDSQMYLSGLLHSESIRSPLVLLKLIEMQCSFEELLGSPGAHFVSTLLSSLLTEHQPNAPSQPESVPEVQNSAELSKKPDF
jgi:hypothetical protein